MDQEPVEHPAPLDCVVFLWKDLLIDSAAANYSVGPDWWKPTTNLDNSTFDNVLPHLDLLTGLNRKGVTNHTFKTYLVPVICILGLFGNSVILFVFSQKRLQKIGEGLAEPMAHAGMEALAASDIFFCASLLPHALIETSAYVHRSPNFQLYYSAYGSVLVNTFILSSTWLTVTLAVSRYCCIRHPVQGFRTATSRTKLILLSVFLSAFIFNIPRFFYESIEVFTCEHGHKVFVRTLGFIRIHHHLLLLYNWFYLVISVILPLVILAHCNINLIQALASTTKVIGILNPPLGSRRSDVIRRRHQRSISAIFSTNRRVTLILIVVIIAFIVFVCPAEILQFVQHTFLEKGQVGYHAKGQFILVAIDVTNAFQTATFSINFILYYLLNIQFRRTLQELIRNRCQRKATRSSGRRMDLGQKMLYPLHLMRSIETVL